MKNIIFLIFLIFVANCSLNNDSNYWSEDNKKRVEKEKELIEIKKKSSDITSMTLNEYELYIDDYTKKSKYPDISK
tara:strand:+ start:159 stop:386 length:228 start_codon:yes stop_codon:yes gene_type:complete